MRSTTLIAAALVLAGCGTTDVEGSSEYRELRDERDVLAADLDDVRARLDELDDELAVAEARRGDAEEQAATGEAVADDLGELLVLDVMGRVGLSPGDARCVADALVEDADVRGAYLLLIDPTQGDSTAVQDAYGRVTVVMEQCGLEIVEDEASAPAEALAQLDGLLGAVEVVGAVLPRFTDAGVDEAVGLEAPVVIGADYAGEPVTIDAAADGPTAIVVMAHWCPHCNAEIPKLNQLRDAGRIPDGVHVVGVSTGLDPDRTNFPPDEWIAAVDWTFPVVADGLDDEGRFLASAAFGTTGFPFVVLVDGDGTVVERWAGERDVEELAAALERLAAG